MIFDFRVISEGSVCIFIGLIDLLNCCLVCIFVSARNDAMEDRYSVLIRLENQLSADGFYCCYNGKRFKPTEVITTKNTCTPVKSSSSFFFFTALSFTS